jgi:hypothetical protein
MATEAGNAPGPCVMGWFALKRGIHDHRIFHKRPDRFFVWTWMIATAAYQDTKQDADGKTVTVKRGQLLTSYRQMSRATGVSVKVVRTLIDRLEAEHAIDTNTGTGRLRITICNYEKYQSSGDQWAQQRAQDGHSGGTEKKQENNIPVGAEEIPPTSSPDEDMSVSSALWRVGPKYLAQHCVKNPRGLIGKWLSQSGGKASEVLAAIEAAQKVGTQDPVPYIQKIISSSGSKIGPKGAQAGAFGFIPEVG